MVFNCFEEILNVKCTLSCSKSITLVIETIKKKSQMSNFSHNSYRFRFHGKFEEVSWNFHSHKLRTAAELKTELESSKLSQHQLFVLSFY